jgi:hypothetical protein
MYSNTPLVRLCSVLIQVLTVWVIRERERSGQWRYEGGS